MEKAHFLEPFGTPRCRLSARPSQAKALVDPAGGSDPKKAETRIKSHVNVALVAVLVSTDEQRDVSFNIPPRRRFFLAEG